MALIKCDVMFDSDKNEFVYVNVETGEVIDSPKKKTSTRTKKVEDTDPVAKLILLEGKYQLNNAAIQLMGVEPDMKLAVKYERVNKTEHPTIGTDESWGTQTGNRLTKSFTVSCRGQQYDRLSEYGKVFIIEPHPTKEGIFNLNGDAEPKEVEDIQTEAPEIEIPEDTGFDLDSLGSESDADVKASDFDFSL